MEVRNKVLPYKSYEPTYLTITLFIYHKHINYNIPSSMQEPQSIIVAIYLRFALAFIFTI